MSLSESLETLAGEVGELEDHVDELIGQLGVAHDQLAEIQFALEDEDASWQLESLLEKLADYRRGVATLDEVYDEAGLG